MRLFIAIECGQLKDYFVDLQKKIPTKYGMFNWTNSFHLTLQFLGDVDNVEKVKGALSNIVFEPFTLTFDHIGYFSPTQPRVVWVGIKNDVKVKLLQEQIVEATALLGFTQDKEFHAHLTLARVKSLMNKKEFKDKTTQINVDSREIVVNSFVLYKSTLTSKGAVYEALAKYDAQDL